MPEMDSSRHAEFGALLIVSNGCIQLNIRAKTCMRCVHTHINTHSAIQTHMYLHTDVGIERNSCKTVCLTYFAQLSRCACFWSGLVGTFWQTLVLVAFPRKTKVSQSFPKFPKVSQSFPNVPASPFRSSLCFVSTPVGVCSEAWEGGFPKETQSSPKKSQAGSPLLLARVRSHSPLS